MYINVCIYTYMYYICILPALGKDMNAGCKHISVITTNHDISMYTYIHIYASIYI